MSSTNSKKILNTRIEVQTVVPKLRCRLNNRSGVEKPHCTKEGPLSRNGSSMTALASKLWIFGGLFQRYGDEDDNGDLVLDRFPLNELWSFDTVGDVWSWYGNHPSVVGEIPSPRWKHSAFSVENSKKLIIIGGALDEHQTVWAPIIPHVFHVDSEMWSVASVHGRPPSIGPMTVSPYESSDGENRILVMGGESVYESIWDGLCLFFAETSSNPRPRRDFTNQAATVRDLVLVFGGGNGIEGFGTSSRVTASEVRGQPGQTADGRPRKESFLPPLTTDKNQNNRNSRSNSDKRGKFFRKNPTDGYLQAFQYLFPTTNQVESQDFSKQSAGASYVSSLNDRDAYTIEDSFRDDYEDDGYENQDAAARGYQQRHNLGQSHRHSHLGNIEGHKKKKKMVSASVLRKPRKKDDVSIVDSQIAYFAAASGIAMKVPKGGTTPKKVKGRKAKPSPDPMLLITMAAEGAGSSHFPPPKTDDHDMKLSSSALVPFQPSSNKDLSLQFTEQDITAKGSNQLSTMVIEGSAKMATPPPLIGGDDGITIPPPMDVIDAAAIGYGNKYVIFGGNSESTLASFSSLGNDNEQLKERYRRGGSSASSLNGGSQNPVLMTFNSSKQGRKEQDDSSELKTPKALGYMYILDCAYNKWSRIEPISDVNTGVFRAGHVMAYIKDEIYIFGGTEGIAADERDIDEMQHMSCANGILCKISLKNCAAKAQEREEAVGAPVDALLFNLAYSHISAADSSQSTIVEDLSSPYQTRFSSNSSHGKKPVKSDKEPDIHEMWANRGVQDWEKKGDITLRLPGECKTIVVKDLSKMIQTVGEENCF